MVRMRSKSVVLQWKPVLQKGGAAMYHSCSSAMLEEMQCGTLPPPMTYNALAHSLPSLPLPQWPGPWLQPLLGCAPPTYPCKRPRCLGVRPSATLDPTDQHNHLHSLWIVNLRVLRASQGSSGGGVCAWLGTWRSFCVGKSCPISATLCGPQCTVPQCAAPRSAILQCTDPMCM